MQVTSISWRDNELNMVDTPGHADFGGEVCLLLVLFIGLSLGSQELNTANLLVEVVVQCSYVRLILF